MNIVITDLKNGLDRDLDFEIELLKQKLPEANVTVYENSGTKEALMDAVRDADIIETALTMLDRDILDAASHLRCVCFNSTGYNNIDLDYAKEKRIAVIPVYEYCTEEVANHAMALILALLRNLKIYEKQVEQRRIWSYKTAYSIHRISEMTLAIFGLGRIGQAVAKRAAAFGMHVIAYDPYLPKEVAEKLGVELCSPEKIWETADIISNHMLLTSENTGFFNESVFQKCKKKPLFINVGRGGSVVEADLIRALDDGSIGGAGLDVLELENPDLSNNPLLGRENVILTPHAAFYSEEAYRSLQEKAVWNMVNFALGRKDAYRSVTSWE